MMRIDGVRKTRQDKREQPAKAGEAFDAKALRRSAAVCRHFAHLRKTAGVSPPAWSLAEEGTDQIDIEEQERELHGVVGYILGQDAGHPAIYSRDRQSIELLKWWELRHRVLTGARVLRDESGRLCLVAVIDAKGQPQEVMIPVLRILKQLTFQPDLLEHLL